MICFSYCVKNAGKGPRVEESLVAAPHFLPSVIFEFFGSVN
jgi:hypothetical protein